MRALADHMHCDASNVTGIADRLEAGGLVERAAHRHDRRVKLLAVTPAGARVREQLGAAVADASPITTRLTAEERDTLRDLLAKAVAGGNGTDGCVAPECG